MDIASTGTFWLDGSHQIVREQFYTATNLARGTPQILVAYVGGRCNADPISGSGSAFSVQDDVIEEAKRITRLLAGELQLQYAFFSFSVNDSQAMFCRAYQYWPNQKASPLASWAVDAILKALETE